MTTIRPFSLLVLGLCTTAGLPQGPSGSGTDARPGLADLNGGALSAAAVGFEENKGQVTTIDGTPASGVRFRYAQGNTSLFLLRDGMAFQFNRLHRPPGLDSLEKVVRPSPAQRRERIALRKEVRLETYRMDMLLEGANPDAMVSTEDRCSGYSNYYTHGALGVHTYRQVTYHDVYPGIDWVLHATPTGMEHDFVVHPGADPSLIRLRFEHQEELRLEGGGNLVHGNRMGRFVERRPVSFQGGREVETRFVLEGDVLHFALAAYDPGQALTIDPVRLWGTYYGGAGGDYGSSCAMDASGNVYLAGSAESSIGMASGGHQNTYGGGDSDAFLVKFDAAGTRLWATYYGGVGGDYGSSCAVDGSNNVYLAGETESATGIASGGHQNTHGGGDFDAFLVKFDPAGTRLWATYYGGSGLDDGISCAVDGSGNAYLAGETESVSGIASGGHQNTYGGGDFDAFLVKFNPTGTRLWATYYGGSGREGGACAVDGSGNVFLAGSTYSTAGIASGGYQNTHGGGLWDAFLVKFDPAGTRLWATYYGGSGLDGAYSCAIDGGGNVYLAGETQSHAGMASGGYQNEFGGGNLSDAFLVKFDAAGNRLWGTYYGGIGWEYGWACTADGDGNAYLAGQTGTTTGLSSGGPQNTYGGGDRDAFMVKFDASGNRLWATYYGGADMDDGFSCSADGNGNVYLVGSTRSTTGIASGGFRNTYSGGLRDAFLVKFGEGPLGVHDPDNAPGTAMIVYPNPAGSGLITIHADGLGTADRAGSMVIVDAGGKLVHRQEVAIAKGTLHTVVDMGVGLAPGLYAVQVVVGEVRLTQRLGIVR
ncbi:MAG: SBBP repeat-containing protein [Flavobacteriales bacterium]|nr:SBBP repeat-containing protein [Flavobacteriales bacterium]MEB2340401.1 SBBP repeat-containing protein [Flavobacteriia bacterium]